MRGPNAIRRLEMIVFWRDRFRSFRRPERKSVTSVASRASERGGDGLSYDHQPLTRPRKRVNSSQWIRWRTHRKLSRINADDRTRKMPVSKL